MAASTSQQAHEKSSTDTENESIVTDEQHGHAESATQTDDVVDVEQTLAKDDIFHILQNERRRQVLRHLKGVEGTVEMREIAEKIAAWENDTTVANLYSDQRQRVYIALYQSHLPKLDDLGVINYNQSRGTIEPTPLIEDVAKYLDVDDAGTQRESRLDTPTRREWAPPVVSVGVVSIALIIAAQVGLFPISLGGLIAAVLATGIVSVAAAQAIRSDQ